MFVKHCLIDGLGVTRQKSIDVKHGMWIYRPLSQQYHVGRDQRTDYK